jgi:hypothetical protein
MSDGRGSNGKFVEGNPGGPGRPRGTTPREAMHAAITAETVAELVALTLAIARDADERTSNRLSAIELLLNRRLGRVPDTDIETQLDELERTVALLVAERKTL